MNLRALMGFPDQPCWRHHDYPWSHMPANWVEKTDGDATRAQVSGRACLYLKGGSADPKVRVLMRPTLYAYAQNILPFAVSSTSTFTTCLPLLTCAANNGANTHKAGPARGWPPRPRGAVQWLGSFR